MSYRESQIASPQNLEGTPIKESGPIEIAVRQIQDELAAIDSTLNRLETNFKSVLAEKLPPMEEAQNAKDPNKTSALEIKLSQFIHGLQFIKGYLNEFNDRCRL